MRMALFRRKEIWGEDPLRFLPRLFVRLYSMWARATYPFASIGRDVEIHYSWDLQKYLAHRVKLGSSIFIGKDVQFGVSCPHREEKGEPVIVIEDGCDINRQSQISARNFIHIERDVLVSSSVLIMDHGHAHEDVSLPIKKQGITPGGKIRIEQGCWIGRGAAVVCSQGELVLGRNSVVAVNAIVTRSFPPYSVIAGNPARAVKQFDPDKQAWVMGSRRLTETEPAKEKDLARAIG